MLSWWSICFRDEKKKKQINLYVWSHESGTENHHQGGGWHNWNIEERFYDDERYSRVSKIKYKKDKHIGGITADGNTEWDKVVGHTRKIVQKKYPDVKFFWSVSDKDQNKDRTQRMIV